MIVEVAVHSSRSLIILAVSVDVQQQGKAIVKMLHKCLWGTCKQLVLSAREEGAVTGVGEEREGGVAPLCVCRNL